MINLLYQCLSTHSAIQVVIFHDLSKQRVLYSGIYISRCAFGVQKKNKKIKLNEAKLLALNCHENYYMPDIMKRIQEKRKRMEKNGNFRDFDKHF